MSYFLKTRCGVRSELQWIVGLSASAQNGLRLMPDLSPLGTLEADVADVQRRSRAMAHTANGRAAVKFLKKSAPAEHTLINWPGMGAQEALQRIEAVTAVRAAAIAFFRTQRAACGPMAGFWGPGGRDRHGKGSISQRWRRRHVSARS